jgi:hypothetical protein
MSRFQKSWDVSTFEERIELAVTAYESLANTVTKKYPKYEGYNTPATTSYRDLLTKHLTIVRQRAPQSKIRCKKCHQRIPPLGKYLYCRVCVATRRMKVIHNIFSKLVLYCQKEKVPCDEFLLAQFKQWGKPQRNGHKATIPLPAKLLGQEARTRYWRWKSGMIPHRTEQEETDRRIKTLKETVKQLMEHNPERYPDEASVLNDPNFRGLVKVNHASSL